MGEPRKPNKQPIIAAAYAVACLGVLFVLGLALTIRLGKSQIEKSNALSARPIQQPRVIKTIGDWMTASETEQELFLALFAAGVNDLLPPGTTHIDQNELGFELLQIVDDAAEQPNFSTTQELAPLLQQAVDRLRNTSYLQASAVGRTDSVPFFVGYQHLTFIEWSCPSGTLSISLVDAETNLPTNLIVDANGEQSGRQQIMVEPGLYFARVYCDGLWAISIRRDGAQ